MIRIRFHGRGGQGIKTASRIVGTAALLDGLQAQDSPVYGAERRGAPVMAFVRLAPEPVLERGLIAVPDLVVVADETLLDDPAARPLAGLAPEGGLLINTAHGADEVRTRTGHAGPVVARDFLAMALRRGEAGAALSTALAAAVGAWLSLSEASVTAAVDRELGAIGLGPARVGAAQALAAEARADLRPVPLAPAPRAVALDDVIDVAWAAPELATPGMTGSPNTPLRRTGSWRVFRPVVDLGRCTRCWICFVRCPDGAITLDADDLPVVDYEGCKGCLLCEAECPTHAIARVREVREWAPAERAS